MKIERYSVNGFVPQFQKYHMDNIVRYHLFGFSEEALPKQFRFQLIADHQRQVPFLREHFMDFQYGIWAFVAGHKDSQSLNHLREKVPCWEAGIDDSAEVFDVNWTEKTTIANPLCTLFGCYIPARELHKIHSVRRKQSRLLRPT